MNKIYKSLIGAAFVAGVALAAGPAQAANEIGTYKLAIKGTDITGALNGVNATISVTVTEEENGDYTITEVGTNYFEGFTPTFTYNESSGIATFTPKYATTMEGVALWFDCFVKYESAMGQDFIEAQDNYAVNFSEEDGFTFQSDDAGFAWYISSNADSFVPEDVYLAFYVQGVNENTPGTTPGTGNSNFAGEWSFTLDWYSLGENITDPFTAEVEGNVVTFESTYGDVFVAEITGENTLTFKIAPVGVPAQYTLTQFPFTSGNPFAGLEATDYTFGEFTATVNADGTVTFPEGCGLLFGTVDSNDELYNGYTTGFNFVSATYEGGEEDNTPGDEDNVYAGEWSFSLDWYITGENTDPFQATVEGNIVTFIDNYGGIFKAEITGENTLTFNIAAVGQPATYTKTQFPFTSGSFANGLQADDFTFGEITATFNGQTGVLTFPQGCGLLFGPADSDGTLSSTGYEEGFKFVSAQFNGGGHDVPTDLGNPEIVGEWEISAIAGTGTFTWNYTAELEGNTVTFTSDTNDIIIAEFTAQNVLTFKKAVVKETVGMYGYYWQQPYVMSFGQQQLKEFDAQFDPTTGVIVFDEDCGLLYGYFNADNEMSGDWNEDFILAAAQKKGNASVNYGDPAIEGTWNFALNGHYLGNYSLGEFSEPFTATLDGNIVTFKSSGSQYNIVAEFVSATQLEFNFVKVTDEESTNTLYQSPYVNTTGASTIEELAALDQTVFVADYIAETGVINFKDNVGLLYGYFDAQGNLVFWDDAFDLLYANTAYQQETVGTYIWLIQQTDMEGQYSGEMAEITVEVRKTGDDTYAIYDMSQNYFKNQVIPFTYSDVTNYATFKAYYAGEISGEPVWFSPFNYNEGGMLEPQPRYDATFDPEVGFDFPVDFGFGWFITPSADEYDPNGVYNAFYVLENHTTAVKGIEKAEEIGAPAEAVYYDLQGRKVNNPKSGLYIKVEGNKAKKVMIKN